jgi:hypothetical protein
MRVRNETKENAREFASRILSITVKLLSEYKVTVKQLNKCYAQQMLCSTNQTLLSFFKF